MTCLVIDGEFLKNLRLNASDTDYGVPGVEKSVRDYYQTMPHCSSLFCDVPLSRLAPVALLGEGGFGAVYLVQVASKEYALKRMSKGYIMQSSAEQQVCAERDILALLDSPFIIKFLRSYRDEQFIYMLLEFASGGHLYQLLRERPEVLFDDEPRGSSAMFYAASITLALEYLHERRIAYRDLKLENVLLDERGHVKLCDMGFARFVLGKTHTLLGTPEYMAPEMIDPPHAHSVEVDWWALGVVISELLTGQEPWDDLGLDTGDAMDQIIAIRDSHDRGPPDLLPRSMILAKDFVHNLLRTKVQRRLGSNGDGQEVRSHSWFSSSRFDFIALASQTLQPPLRPDKKCVERTLEGTLLKEQNSSLYVACRNGYSIGWDEAF